MIGLTSKVLSIDFENGLLVSLYIKHFSEISNPHVKKIILKNKANLKKALENTHPEVFDVKHEYEFGVAELEALIDRMPNIEQKEPKSNPMQVVCGQNSFGSHSDKASTAHGNSVVRSRFGSAVESELSFHQN